MYLINITNIKNIIRVFKPVLLSFLIKRYIKKYNHLCLAVIIYKDIKDINFLINRSLDCKIILINNKNGLYIIRQSCAFLCAFAIKRLWPEKKEINIYITEDGFLYDFDLSYRISKNDLNIIEKEMHLILKNFSSKIKISLFNKKEAYSILKKNNETYIIHNIKTNFKYRPLIKIFNILNYFTLNPFFLSTNINAYSHFKLKDISGVYLNNSSKMIQRINGIVFSNDLDLKNFMFYLEKIRERDHRKINISLDLFHIEKDNPGLVFWHENGFVIFNQLKEFLRNKLKFLNYKEIQTPIILKEDLWKKTGHLTFYKKYMFFITQKHNNLCMKPMNCPGHVQIYKQTIKSYKDLPLKLSEFGNCFRNESSGSLHGLMRLKSFTQDDAHIFCTREQLNKEIQQCIKLLYDIYTKLGFKHIIVRLSTRPNNRYGTEEEWDKAEIILANILIKENINFNYKLNSGAFYGPKIEFILKDNLNRQWQCGTLQVDFSLSKRLNVFFFDKKNKKQHPIIIHRAILGSIERFIGILLEEYNGDLPLWLSPIQVIVVNITSNQEEYAKHINNILLKSNIRSCLDIRSEKLSFKIREHLRNKINYIIICGKKETEKKKISFRNKYQKIKNLIPINHFIFFFFLKINNR